MKRLILSLMLAGTLLATTSLATMAEAVAATEMVRVPYAQSLVAPCTGEPVVLTGELLLVFHETQDAGGGFHGDFVLVPNSVRGEGASGTQYQAVGGARNTFNTNGATEFTATSMFNLVSRGGADNLLVEELFHITFNAQGEPTAIVEQFNVRCVG